jgi:hypothetical protein
MLSQDFSASGSVRPKYMHRNVLELDHIPPLSRNRRCSKRYENENSRQRKAFLFHTQCIGRLSWLRFLVALRSFQKNVANLTANKPRQF